MSAWEAREDCVTSQKDVCVGGWEDCVTSQKDVCVGGWGGLRDEPKECLQGRLGRTA